MIVWGNFAPGAVLLNESFPYADGALVSVSAGSWTTHSGVTGEVGVIAGRVDLRVPSTEDVNVLLPGQPYPATTNVLLYASFTINLSTLPSAAGTYFAHFKGAGTSVQRAKVYVLTSGAGAGQYRIGLANAGNTAAIATAASLNLNTDYRIYLRYALSNATSTLWIDPTNELSGSITATDIVGVPGTVTSFALRQDTGIGVLQFDDLKIGTTFADVYTGSNTIPPSITQQPADAATIEGGAATFVASASGTAPLIYQWLRNGLPVGGATNATLTLTSASTNAAGYYSLSVSNSAGVANSSAALLTVIVPNASGTLNLVHHNVKGNFASDWSTNAPQVQAIARQFKHLNPDIITLNEIPNGLRYEMTNWMAAFFPTYQLVISPGTDNVLRSGVISRFPILRSQSWLLNASLTNFGYNGTFVRDLFEAEISVPGATESLHVFTTHLKSGPDPDSQNQRAAECSAVSNFFATVFLSTNGWKPYLLTGDLNEDNAIPLSQNQQPIQRLVSAPTGLKLTTPLNPFTLARFTHSIQGSLDARFDYVLPNGLLSSNIAVSQVFRSDKLVPPAPPLLTNDSVTASDHLPVQVIFNYPDPPLRTTLSRSNQTVTLTWPALVGRNFMIQSSTNLATWTVVAASVPATSAQPTWTASATNAARYYRVVRLP